jgi:hypothetical protein
MKALAIQILTSPAFPLVTLLLGFLVGHRLAVGRDQIHNFNRAAEKLREAFQPLLIIVNPHQYALNEELFKILERDFDRHKQAIIEFSNFLRSDKTKRAFLKAWQEYHCHEGQYDENCLPFFEKYWMLGKTDDQRHAIFKLVETRIKNINQEYTEICEAKMKKHRTKGSSRHGLTWSVFHFCWLPVSAQP